MKLSYRGHRYESATDCLPTAPSGTVGQYRGSTYSIRQGVEVAPRALCEMKYRGTTYLASASDRAAPEAASWRHALV